MIDFFRGTESSFEERVRRKAKASVAEESRRLDACRSVARSAAKSSAAYNTMAESYWMTAADVLLSTLDTVMVVSV